ncbi:MAG: outer membrane beta-barrel protein [Planctomycetota bacterium]|nr:outer membrane beta-barrel protein [Planctomycetota bacterium]MDA1137330.1 outer membrane beta-barrel protein [Planctomycetota bacterium]
MNRFLSLLAGVSLLCGTARAADVEFSGLIDVGYIHNTNDPGKGANNNSKVLGIWNAEDTFQMGLAQLNTHIEADPVGFDLKLSFFNQATLDFGSNAGDDIAAEEAYLTWKTDVGNGLKFQAGRMASLLGMEVNETIYNNHMTHSLQWRIVPFTHVGVRATYSVSDNLDVALGLTNGANKNVDTNHGKTLEGMVTCSVTEAWTNSIQFNYGAEGANESDKTLAINAWSSYDLSEQTSGYIEFTYTGAENPTGTRDANFWGIGISAIHWLTDMYGLSARLEYVDDQERGTVLAGKYNWEVTFTGHCKVTENLMVRLEFRHDETNPSNFNGDQGANTEDDQNVIGVQMIYSF